MLINSVVLKQKKMVAEIKDLKVKIKMKIKMRIRILLKDHEAYNKLMKPKTIKFYIKLFFYLTPLYFIL